MRQYHYDSRGSTIAVTDSAQTTIQQYAYDPFGRVANTTGTEANPFGFLGRYGVLDEGEDLSYIRARYYDTEQQRFVSKDNSLGQERSSQLLNRYAFAGGNPLRFIDVSGFSPKEVVGAIQLDNNVPTNTTIFIEDLLITSKAAAPDSLLYQYLGWDSQRSWANGAAIAGVKIAGSELAKSIANGWFQEGVKMIVRPAADWVERGNNVFDAQKLISASNRVESALGFIKFTGLLVGGYGEILNRGYSLEQFGKDVFDRDVYVFAAQNPDALLQALTEGFASTAAVTVNSLSYGVTDFSGKDVERAVGAYVDKVNEFNDAYSRGIQHAGNWLGDKLYTACPNCFK